MEADRGSKFKQVIREKRGRKPQVINNRATHRLVAQMARRLHSIKFRENLV